MNILDEIIAYKRTEVDQRRHAVSISALERQPLFNRETISLRQSLLDDSRTGIIAEFKRRSPSKGMINDRADVNEVTAAYTGLGASGLSVLTDAHFFGGSSDDLIRSRVNQVPILRKDFMIDDYQFVEAKAIGADVVLLIAACLTALQVRDFSRLAHSLGLEVLLEVHNEKELDSLCDEVDLVGVNNRDLKSFSVDVERSIELAARIPKEKIRIAESGINATSTIKRLKKNGFQGFLIGEHFMKESDPPIAFASFVNALKKEMHEGESMRNDAT